MSIEEALRQFKDWEQSGWSNFEVPNHGALELAIEALEEMEREG